MEIRIEQDAALAETQVIVRCAALGPQELELLAGLRVYQARLTGEKDGETHILPAGEVLYADTADRKTFLYTANGVYETPLRLYELEQKLAGQGFLRAGKNLVVNFEAIRSLRPDFGGRLIATLSNGERVGVSRQYVAAFKQKLGL